MVDHASLNRTPGVAQGTISVGIMSRGDGGALTHPDLRLHRPARAPRHAHARGVRAQVIKIEDPVTEGRWTSCGGWSRSSTSGGAASSAVASRTTTSRSWAHPHLRTERGRELLAEIVRISGRRRENFAAGVLAPRLPYERLREIRDDVIYVSTAGSATAGPTRRFKTWGPIVQACCGLTYTSGSRPASGRLGLLYMDHHAATSWRSAILTAARPPVPHR